MLVEYHVVLISLFMGVTRRYGGDLLFPGILVPIVYNFLCSCYSLITFLLAFLFFSVDSGSLVLSHGIVAWSRCEP
jgi:hypothetical protein